MEPPSTGRKATPAEQPVSQVARKCGNLFIVIMVYASNKQRMWQNEKGIAKMSFVMRRSLDAGAVHASIRFLLLDGPCAGHIQNSLRLCDSTSWIGGRLLAKGSWVCTLGLTLRIFGTTHNTIILEPFCSSTYPASGMVQRRIDEPRSSRVDLNIKYDIFYKIWRYNLWHFPTFSLSYFILLVIIELLSNYYSF